MKNYLNYINGKWVRSERLFDNINPVTEVVVGKVHEASQKDVDHAARAARQALKGPWGAMSLGERCAILQRVAAGIRNRFDDFVAAEIEDTGKPISQAREVDIPRGAANFETFAELVKAYPDEAYHTTTPTGISALNYTYRRPLGVIGVIAPWNLPLLLLTWKLAPALAAGNTILAKPSEETPGTATLLAEVMEDARIPAGVFNLLHGFGAGSAGEYLVAHKDVDAITFTGESKTGTAIMKSAAQRVKPLSFELGGKNAAILFEDCDLEKTLDGLVRAVFLNNGQVCMCTERVFVARPIFDRVVEGLRKRVKALVLGDPFEKSTTTGPLISKAHREKVLGYYKLAEQEGARVVIGGLHAESITLPAEGFFVAPTIWTGLPDESRINTEEIFGPCCHISSFEDEQEVVDRANDSDYGLCASIWTQDIARAHRAAQRMEVGITWINSWYLRDLRTAFGGSKQSGIGREGGLYSLNFYSEPSNICIQF